MALTKKNVLGRGLEALIPRNTEEAPRETAIKIPGDPSGKPKEIALTEIEPNPFQPRSDFDEAGLQDLVRSVKEKGVIQPIMVRKTDKGYQLVSGERRYRAAQLAGLHTVPSHIIEVKTDEEMLELALIENIQREDLNPLEVALSYQKLIQTYQYTQDTIAKKVGKDRTSVTNFLRLLKLPQKIQDSVRKGQVSMGHARALLSFENQRLQMRVFEKVLSHGLSVREVERIAQNLTTKGKKGQGSLKVKPSSGQSEVRAITERLTRTFGTKVVVRAKNDGKGEIVIDFYSFDDLERLLDLISLIDKHS